MVEVASVTVGAQAVYRDSDQRVAMRCHTDASAAKSIARRKGLGKLRHMAIHVVWLQEAAAAGED